jgi:pimeloyl-ACP methyl ester carboxylesterase
MTDRPALVLIPGLLCTAELWRAQVDGLADVAEITVTEAHREHGSIAEIARAILADAPERFHLAGLSMGGYIAFEIMRQAPERVERLALLDTTARPDPPERVRQREDALELVGRGRFHGVTDKLIEQFVHENRVGEKVLFDKVKAMARDYSEDEFVRQMTAIMGRPDSRPDLPAIACPTMVLCGREDALTPLEMSDEMARLIPGAVPEVIEFCGHLPPLERPAFTNAAFRRWLGR